MICWRWVATIGRRGLGSAMDEDRREWEHRIRTRRLLRGHWRSLLLHEEHLLLLLKGHLLLTELAVSARCEKRKERDEFLLSC